RWEEQHVGRGLLRAEMTWRGGDDTGPQLVRALRGMHDVRFEGTQEATAHTDGARWTCTPEPRIPSAAPDRPGHTLLTEDHVRGCMERAGNDPLALKRELGIALGEPWDEDLEIYRHAGEGVPMRWLHRVS